MPSQETLPEVRSGLPTVSIVVRSMGRPELRHALLSIAAQDYPAIEAIVVDATGGRHPALPSLEWKSGHTLRLVTRDARLPRPMAANVGLESVTGEWFSFLDDDDTCEPHHVSTLVAAAQAHPDSLVIYGCGRLFDADGRSLRIFGRPFNRALMHFGPLFYWQASLINTRARDLGCRFDPALAVCEDRDFLAQIAQHGDFVFLPSAATFNYRPDLGTSGTGHGANRDAARVARFENLLRAKWAGEGALHNERAARRCREGVRAYSGGDLASARQWFEGALREYPDDPNALHGLAGVALAEGRFEDARACVRKAIEINPQAAEYHATLARIEGHAMVVPAAPRAPETPSRNALCPCGSGLRYKMCHGRLERPSVVPPPSDVTLDRARREIERGDAQAAQTRLRDVTAASGASREQLLAAARLELDLGDAGAAFPLLERAAAMHIDHEAGLMLEECCSALVRDARDRSLWSTIDGLTAASPNATARQGPVCIVASASSKANVGQASLLRDALGVRAEVVAAASGRSVDVAIPASTLVQFDLDVEIATPRGVPPARVVVRMDRDDPEALVRALARLRDTHPGAQLQYTRPFDDAGNGAAKLPVEYPWIDPSLSGRGALHSAMSDAVTVGRAYRLDDHPNDPALYRRLMAGGIRIATPATRFLERAFRDDPPQSRPLLQRGAAQPMPDIVLLRLRPGHRGRADASILEALAAARSVVVFEDTIGAREWIDHGRDGFIVRTETEAEACVAELARDSELRAAVGLAARVAAVRIVDVQRAQARAFYLGVSVNE